MCLYWLNSLIPFNQCTHLGTAVQFLFVIHSIPKPHQLGNYRVYNIPVVQRTGSSPSILDTWSDQKLMAMHLTEVPVL